MSLGTQARSEAPRAPRFEPKGGRAHSLMTRHRAFFRAAGAQRVEPEDDSTWTWERSRAWEAQGTGRKRQLNDLCQQGKESQMRQNIWTMKGG